MKKMLIGISLMLSTVGAHAGGLDVALSNETVNLSVILNPYQLELGGGSELSVGGFISEQGDKLTHATLLVRGYRQAQSSQYSLGAGLKAIGGDIVVPEEYNTSDDDESVIAIGIGFQASLLLASSQSNPVELSFEGFLAPSITSFSEAQKFSEIGARVQIEIVPQARAYIGYRRMSFDTNDYANIRLDRSLHLGIKLSF